MLYVECSSLKRLVHLTIFAALLGSLLYLPLCFAPRCHVFAVMLL